MSFKVGDRVVIVKPTKAWLLGAVATVVQIKIYTGNDFTEAGWGNEIPPGTALYELDIPSEVIPGENIGYPASHLEPYRPDDRDEGEWTEELLSLCKGKSVSA